MDEHGPFSSLIYLINMVIFYRFSMFTRGYVLKNEQLTGGDPAEGKMLMN